MPEPDFISFKVVAARTGLSRATLYNLVDRGELPRPTRLSINRVAFPADAVEAWLAAKKGATVTQ